MPEPVDSDGLAAVAVGETVDAGVAVSSVTTVVVVFSAAGAASVVSPVDVAVSAAPVAVAPAVAVELLLATTARPEPDDRTANEEPPLEAAAGALPAERARAGPADPFPRPELAELPELLPALLAECGAAPESDDPPSALAEAMPCPAPTAKPSPTAAAKIPLRAACRPLRDGGFR